MIQATVLLLVSFSCAKGDLFGDFSEAHTKANAYLEHVKFQDTNGRQITVSSPDDIPYGKMDANEVTGIDTITGQPIDVGCLELLTTTALNKTYKNFSDTNNYQHITTELLDMLTDSGMYGAFVKGKAWRTCPGNSHPTAWIAGCAQSSKYDKQHKKEDLMIVEKVMSKRGSFNLNANSIPADTLNNASEWKLASISAWQRPLLDGTDLGATRKLINGFCSTPVVNPFHMVFSFNQEMKYAMRDVMEHWFLVCKFTHEGQDLYVRIERTQTGIFASRCEFADQTKGHSHDSAACQGVEGSAVTASIIEQYENKTANGNHTLDDVLKHCMNHEVAKYSMFTNNCRQFAKMACDKFAEPLQIPSLDKGYYQKNSYGATNGEDTY